MTKLVKVSIGAAVAALGAGIWWMMGSCRHKKMSRPFTSMPWDKKGTSYVVCLGCGKEYDYDLRNLKVGAERGRNLKYGSAR